MRRIITTSAAAAALALTGGVALASIPSGPVRGKCAANRAVGTPVSRAELGDMSERTVATADGLSR